MLTVTEKGSYRERLIPAAQLPHFPDPPYQTAYPCLLPDGDYLELPFLPLPPDFETAIAFLCSNQTSFEVEDRLSTYMADLVRDRQPEVVGSGLLDYQSYNPQNSVHRPKMTRAARR